MRAPRHRFSDRVRSATRDIASRMVDEHAIAETPEQLDSWIAANPDIRKSLVAGGYNQVFTAHDLFPLLQVFIVQAGGPAPAGEAAPPPSRRGWKVGLLLGLGLLAVAVLVAVLA